MKKTGIIILLTLYANYSNATQLVYDPENYGQAVLQLDALGEQITALNSQLLELEKQYSAITGKNAFDGGFENQTFWDFLNELEDMQDVVRAGGGSSNPDLNKIAEYYKEKYQAAPSADYYLPENENSGLAISQSDHATAVMEGLTMSEYYHSRVNSINEMLRDFQDKGYKLETQKESIDFGNNLQVEMMRIINELLKLQAQQYNLMAKTEVVEMEKNKFNSNFFNTDFHEEN